MTTASISGREHYELMEFFERTHSHLRLDHEIKDLWSNGNVYQSGEANAIFIAFRKGYELGKVIQHESI